MNFWNRVEEILDASDINKKTLAAEVGIDPSNITKGIKDNNCPSADTAVKIARFLHTTVEYLVTGQDPTLTKEDSKKLDILYKYSRTIDSLERIPENSRTPIENMISEMEKKYNK